MKFQLIRNATLRLEYAGKTILVDPMLCAKNTFPPFVPGLLPNPIVDLTMPAQEVAQGVDAVIVTHSHPDHFDDASKDLLSPEVQLFCTPTDQNYEKFEKFSQKAVVHDNIQWEGIHITRIEGQHGSGAVLPYMGETSGFVLQAINEPTIYIVSDSIWTEGVAQAIATHQPDVIVTNSGGGIIPGFEQFPVILDEAQTIVLAKAANQAKVVAVHLESIDFCRVTRQSLRAQANEAGISEEQLLIPVDGEKLEFEAVNNETYSNK